MSFATGRLAVVVKGYPRLSETFIAQEILGLEARGVSQMIVSLRHPTEGAVHDLHRAIRAEVMYLPEYLKDDRMRVKAAIGIAEGLPGFERARALFKADLRRDRSPSRRRRWGQACVLAAELPADIRWLHTHYLHTPASVTRYAAILLGRPWSFSAHAKDIWTTPRWELADKLADAAWGATCTRVNADYLRGLANDPAKVLLVYHGLDIDALDASLAPRTPAAIQDRFRIVTVGRAVEKKGFGDLLRALALLPDHRRWQLTHVGSGPMLARLQSLAARLGLEDRVTWLGARPRSAVFERYRDADLFVLPSRIARSGDRDGLPNVLMEAQLCGLACISTRVSAIPELIEDGRTGILVEPEDPRSLAMAIDRLIGDRELRDRLAAAGERRVRQRFSSAPGLDMLAGRFLPLLAAAPC